MKKIIGLILLAGWVPAQALNVRVTEVKLPTRLPTIRVPKTSIGKPQIQLPSPAHAGRGPSGPLVDLPWINPDDELPSGVVVIPARKGPRGGTYGAAVKALEVEGDGIRIESIDAIIENVRIPAKPPVVVSLSEPGKGGDKETPPDQEDDSNHVTPPEWALEDEIGLPVSR